MATFTFEQIFGSNFTFSTSPLPEAELTINLYDFLDQANGENLPEGLGVDDPQTMTATQVLYALLLMLKTNQGETVNTDPTQKVYIQDAGKSIATGARDGQVKRSFTISFFMDAELAGIPSINQIDPVLP
jgi:hypothetical protein